MRYSLLDPHDDLHIVGIEPKHRRVEPAVVCHVISLSLPNGQDRQNQAQARRRDPKQGGKSMQRYATCPPRNSPP